MMRDGLSRHILLARAALLWERGWPPLFPALAVVGVFLVLAFSDLLPAFGGWVHALVLALALGAFLYALWRAIRFWRMPDIAAGRRRLEQASGLQHRPLATLADTLPPGADADQRALWEAHRARMARLARNLRVGAPKAGWGRVDVWGVRAGIALLILVALADAGERWGDRLLRALKPNFAAAAIQGAPTLDVWLTPPEYTGLAPLFLQRGATETVEVPVGSAVLAQVSGGKATPKLSFAADAAAEEFGRVDAKSWKFAGSIQSGNRLQIEQDANVLGSWPIEVIADDPPKIAFASPPQRTQRAALRLDFQASDDYGVDNVHALITRKDGKGGGPLDLELPLPGQRLKETRAASFHDLTPHPWAGLPVEIRLRAADATGQTAETEPFEMTLPERIFNHPIARAIVEQRKQLALEPDEREAVAETLSDLSARPGLYGNDTVVFLSLRMAQARLLLDKTGASVEPVQQLLWETALRIEDGQLSLAERDLRRLQQQLQEALAKNAPDPEIEKLINELQEAMDRYLREMAQNMERQDPRDMQRVPYDPDRMVTRDDLQKMLEKARELSRSGSKDAARELLSKLQQMLENLKMARPQQGQGQNQAQQMMRNMREMMQRQQQLLDRSFRAQRGQQQQQGQRGQRGQQQQGQQGQQGQEGQEGEQGQVDMGDAAQQQEALRRMLGEMMRQMGEGQGEIPQPFGRAERAMRGAAEALQQGQPGQAVGPQTDALDQLQQAMQSMAEQMQNQMAGEGEGEPQGQPDMNAPRQRVDRDPLGRPLSGSGNYDLGDVKIPEQGDLQKTREILDELRRRAGDRARPEVERDYIDRLLKRF
jgi:uncharacterized protein (TIGR02302 family)